MNEQKERYVVWFMSGDHADIEATSAEEAKRGPWNPSFGAVVSVERFTEAYTPDAWMDQDDLA